MEATVQQRTPEQAQRIHDAFIARLYEALEEIVREQRRQAPPVAADEAQA